MSRYDETKAALTEILEGLGAEPTRLYDVGACPWLEKVLARMKSLTVRLDREKVIELFPGKSRAGTACPNHEGENMSDDVQIHPNSPVHFTRWCGHEGYTKWGSFAKDHVQGQIEWRCMEHLANEYWDGRLAARHSPALVRRAIFAA